VITGQSGAGKTTRLLRSPGRLWPSRRGRCAASTATREMFLSQLPYVPAGFVLRTGVCYPEPRRSTSRESLRDTLTRVALATADRSSDEERDWAKVLSPGEQHTKWPSRGFCEQTQCGPSLLKHRRSTRGSSTRCISACRTITGFRLVSVSHGRTLAVPERHPKACRRRPVAAGPVSREPAAV